PETIRGELCKPTRSFRLNYTLGSLGRAQQWRIYQSATFCRRTEELLISEIPFSPQPAATISLPTLRTRSRSRCRTEAASTKPCVPAGQPEKFTIHPIHFRHVQDVSQHTCTRRMRSSDEPTDSSMCRILDNVTRTCSAIGPWLRSPVCGS